MVNIVGMSFKEGVNKDTEKKKEYANSIEKNDVNEISEFQNKIVHEADTETAKTSSLASLIESNKSNLEYAENKSMGVSEQKEKQECLFDEQKENIRELTDWSDEILEALGSWKEAEIYREARLIEAEINGKKCLIREDIDLNQEDEDGISNRDRLERGRPPLDKDGNEIELHHIGQKQTSPLAELTIEQHRGVGNDTVLHDKTKKTEIDRNEFSKERREHWKDRVGLMEGEE